MADGADGGTAPSENTGPIDLTYAEHFHPARPRALRHRPKVRSPFERRAAGRDGEPTGTNPAYVAWLRGQSMLADADTIARQFSGRGTMWQNPYADPDPRAAVDTASVWFTAYPLSFMTRPGQPFLAAMAEEDLWRAFAAIGVEGVHTGPVKRAGGISGWEHTPSVDGHFDRISTVIDPAFGSEADFRAMCGMATFHGGTVIDDVVPGHTGKGADFRLAEMGFADYPGIFHMVEIDPEDWSELPVVPPGRDSVNLDVATEERLEKAGYIIGALQRVIFHAPGVKETNWSATKAVVGIDGTARRWVYLHYFKEGQPSINWLDPSFAGMRLTIGDALHSLADLGSGALRLDANGFLGVEKSALGGPAWSEGHPLSGAANHLIASMVRKVGGFTFQELNLTMDDIREVGRAGADLSYDFVNRPGYHHALATGDAEFLRLGLRTARDLGIDPASLVHALQNHDEMTYELVHWAAGHRDETVVFRGEEVTGAQLAETVRGELLAVLAGPEVSYNLVFTTNGIASTIATVIAASIGVTDLDHIGPAEVEEIRAVHLMLAMFNAMQPGVFALSGWDLTGMLTLPVDDVADLVSEGDTRWIHRGAHDLMGHAGDADRSAEGMPRGRSLYGTLPEQLADETSFARQLQAILAVRKHYGIATARQVDIPDVSHAGLLVLVHELDSRGERSDGEKARTHALTVLNFGAEPVRGTIRSEALAPGSAVLDMFTQEPLGFVDDLHAFAVDLSARRGMALLVEPS